MGKTGWKGLAGVLFFLLCLFIAFAASAIGMGVTNKKGVNVREEPSKKSKQLEQISNPGTEVIIGELVHGSDADYYEVWTLKENHGYIRADLLDILPEWDYAEYLDDLPEASEPPEETISVKPLENPLVTVTVETPEPPAGDTVTVFFVCGEEDAEDIPEPQVIPRGTTASIPPFPTRPGYQLDGWYDGEEKFSFETPVLQDLHLTARWKEQTALTDEEIAVLQETQQAISAEMSSFTDGSGYLRENVSREEAFREIYRQVQEYQQQGTVGYCALEEYGVYFEYACGIPVFLTFSEEGTSAGGGECTIFTFSPFEVEGAGNRQWGNHASGSAAVLTERLDRMDTKGTNFVREEVTPEGIMELLTPDTDVLLWDGHGFYLNTIGPSLVINKITDNWLDILTMADDWYRQKHLVVCCIPGSDDTYYALTPKFIRDFVKLDQAFVYLSTCHSGEDHRLSDAFLEAGALAVVCNEGHDLIQTRYTEQMLDSIVQQMAGIKYPEVEYEEGKMLSVGQALQYSHDWLQARYSGYQGTSFWIHTEDGTYGYQNTRPMIHGDSDYMFAGAVKGKIVLGDPMMRMEDVTVRIRGFETDLETVPSETGFFQIDQLAEGEYVLEVYYLGILMRQLDSMVKVERHHCRECDPITIYPMILELEDVFTGEKLAYDTISVELISKNELPFLAQEHDREKTGPIVMPDPQTEGRYLLILRSGAWQIRVTKEEYEDGELEYCPVTGRMPETFTIEMYPKDTAREFYEYLRDVVVPVEGRPKAQEPGDPVSLTEFSPDFGGLLSAVVCDLNGDGQPEMLTVCGKVYPNRFTYRMDLYHRDPETRQITHLDSFEEPRVIEDVSGGGRMSVHLQKSEGSVYIFCDYSMENGLKDALAYTGRRILRIDGEHISNISEFDGTISGNSGVALHRQNNGETMLCNGIIDSGYFQQEDYTHLDEYLRKPKEARSYSPVVKDLEPWLESEEVELQPVDQLIAHIEAQLCPVVHWEIRAENGTVKNRYDTPFGCFLDIETDQLTGRISKITIWERTTMPATYLEDPLRADVLNPASREMTDLYRTVLSSEALGLSDGVLETLRSFELKGNTYQEEWDLEGSDLILLDGIRETNTGAAAVRFDRVFYMAGAEYAENTVTISLTEQKQQPEQESREDQQKPESSGVEIWPGKTEFPEIGCSEEELIRLRGEAEYRPEADSMTGLVYNLQPEGPGGFKNVTYLLRDGHVFGVVYNNYFGSTGTAPDYDALAADLTGRYGPSTNETKEILLAIQRAQNPDGTEEQVNALMQTVERCGSWITGEGNAVVLMQDYASLMMCCYSESYLHHW